MTAVSCERSQRRGPGCYQHRRPTEHTALLRRDGMSARLCTDLQRALQSRPVESWFLDRVKRHPRTGCWEWQRGTNRKGYGSVRFGGRSFPTYLAHRVSYVLFCGDLADGVFVCHACDNPLCVNPVHLFVGDQQANMDDMRRKGRWGGPVGERSQFAKLTAADVVVIRQRYGNGESPIAIGRDYGITYNAVFLVATGRKWKHVPGACPSRGYAQPFKLTAEHVALAKQLRADGLTYRQIGERFGVVGNTVHRTLREWDKRGLPC